MLRLSESVERDKIERERLSIRGGAIRESGGREGGREGGCVYQTNQEVVETRLKRLTDIREMQSH